MTGGEVTKKGGFFPFAGPFLQVPTGRLGVGQNEIFPGLAWQNRHEAGPHQIAYSQTGKLRLSIFASIFYLFSIFSQRWEDHWATFE